MYDTIVATKQSTATDEVLFVQIADDLRANGYSVSQSALPSDLTEGLILHLADMDATKFEQAGIGREQNHTHDETVRRDAICWINGESQAGQAWLNWMQQLQQFLNRHLYLGLFSFESHFAHYQPGDFYKRHVDAFKGEGNRVLSVAIYLNRDWRPEDGGELVLYSNDNDKQGVVISPKLGTIVVFLSEDFPHEVLVSNRDRYSIAGWFRINTSTTARVDPPR